MTKPFSILVDQTAEFKALLETNNVVCRKCGFGQIAKAEFFPLGSQDHHVKWFNCLRCAELNFFVFKGSRPRVGTNRIFRFQTVLSHPDIRRSFVLPEDLAPNVKADYREATKLLSVSPAASAAFARRCLQTILKHQGYTKSKLVKQIEDVLKETDPAKIVPHYITTSLDAVRNFGNFSAHEITDKATAEILDVEPGEAEWCLEILEDLIEHYFVRPAAEKAKIDKLNERLRGAGQPEIRSPPANRAPSECGDV